MFQDVGGGWQGLIPVVGSCVAQENKERTRQCNNQQVGVLWETSWTASPIMTFFLEPDGLGPVSCTRQSTFETKGRPKAQLSVIDGAGLTDSLGVVCLGRAIRFGLMSMAWRLPWLGILVMDFWTHANLRAVRWFYLRLPALACTFVVPLVRWFINSTSWTWPSGE